ncbi:MAG: leucine-rich repeat domain-containing protein [Holosporales bacterium]|nr:leucine-rich repeat domain-containing protein [Holosporales bacterium]
MKAGRFSVAGCVLFALAWCNGFASTPSGTFPYAIAGSRVYNGRSEHYHNAYEDPFPRRVFCENCFALLLDRVPLSVKKDDQNACRVVIPSDVYEILEHMITNELYVAFEPKSKLRRIPRGVFSRARSLLIPASVEIISEHACSGSWLKTVSVERGSRLRTISQNAFGYSQLLLIDLSNARSLGSVGFGAFQSCQSLVFVQLPLANVRFGEYVFHYTDLA